MLVGHTEWHAEVLTKSWALDIRRRDREPSRRITTSPRGMCELRSEMLQLKFVIDGRQVERDYFSYAVVGKIKSKHEITN